MLNGQFQDVIDVMLKCGSLIRIRDGAFNSKDLEAVGIGGNR